MCLIPNQFIIFFPARNQHKEPEPEKESRRPKVANICIPSQNDRDASTVSSSTDDGGFNEPSPEIKAKLKPPYQFDVNSPPLPPSPPARTTTPSIVAATTIITDTDSYPTATVQPVVPASIANKIVPPPPLPLSPPDVFDDDKPDLTYVDIVHDPPKTNGCNGYEPALDLVAATSQHQSVLYSTIKPEIPPPTELLLETEIKDEAKLLDIDDITTRESSFIPVADDFDPDDPAEKPLPAVPIEAHAIDEELSEVEEEEEEDEEVEEHSGAAPDPMTIEEADHLLSSR